MVFRGHATAPRSFCATTLRGFVDGRLLQIILPRPALSCQSSIMSTCDAALRQKDAQRQAVEEAVSIDIERAPLIRARLLQAGRNGNISGRHGASPCI
jgi:hypothetical protein